MIPLGFEPKTHSLEGCCSIQLSYGTNIANQINISECKSTAFLPFNQTFPQLFMERLVDSLVCEIINQTKEKSKGKLTCIYLSALVLGCHQAIWLFRGLPTLQL